jgi:uncharacterized protein YqgC (DUF456 family)
MNVVEPGSPAESMIGRAKALILRPLETWDTIDQEEATVEGLYKTWVIPLAAIPAVCGAVRNIGFGGSHLFGVDLRPSIGWIVGQTLVGYVLTLVAVFLLAVVVDHLAITFGGVRSRTQAFKLGAYAATPGWVAGIFLLLPAVGGLLAAFGALYGLYLLYLGLPTLMRSDPERTVPYFVAALGATIVLLIVIGGLTSCLGNFGGPISL